jgi:phosphotransferase system  glucose/maltose/N-acetylglucosamine-specific IIC component
MTDIGKKIRRFGLIGLIVSDVLALAFSAYLGFTLPEADRGMAWSVFQFLVIVTSGVILSEIISVIFWKKTVSTMIKHLTQKYGWMGWVLQGLIYSAFIFLAIHWVWIW